MNINNIAVFGGADVKSGSELYQEVSKVTRILARNGYTIVDGGGPGVMMAATQGANAVGGKTISVTFDPKDAPGFEGRYVKNITDKEIKTGNYVERMFKLMEYGDCYVVFRGGTGTLSELATAWCLARLYFGHHKPFILYGEFWQEIVLVLYKHLMMRGNEDKIFKIVRAPVEVLEAIKVFSEEMEKGIYLHHPEDAGNVYTR